jgi:orotidine-5'-phosphate decarboxylase
VGLELFVAAGARAVHTVKTRGGKVFLDLKLHDIPETVARAVAAAIELGVEFLTVHTAGGHEMLRRAHEAAEGRTKILGVTVLTSLSDEDLNADGIEAGVLATVRRRAALAMRAGISGLVCSPHEVGDIRAQDPDRKISLVVPGVRPAGADLGDQKRVATPAQAIRNGADYLVVGRPLRDAPRPAEAFAEIAREIESAEASGGGAAGRAFPAGDAGTR